MDDYKQPDTPETADEVEMLLDQQAVDLTLAQAGQTGSDSAEYEATKGDPVEVVSEVAKPSEAEPTTAQLGEAEPVEVEPAEAEITETMPEGTMPVEEAVEADSALNLTEEPVQEQPEATEEPTEEPTEAHLSSSESEEQSENAQKSDTESNAESDTAQSEPQLTSDQAVTLDAIQDPESVKIVNKAKQLLNDLDEAQKDKTRLTGELKQSEKAYSSMERSVAEGITTALKKKKKRLLQRMTEN